MKLYRYLPTFTASAVASSPFPSGSVTDSIQFVIVSGEMTITDTVTDTDYLIGGTNPAQVKIEFGTPRTADQITVTSAAGADAYALYRISEPPSSVFHSCELKLETAAAALLADREDEISVPIFTGITSDEMENSCVTVCCPSAAPKDFTQGIWAVNLRVTVFTVYSTAGYAEHVSRVGLIRDILFDSDLRANLSDAVENFTVVGDPQPKQNTNGIKGKCFTTTTEFTVPCVGMNL